MTTSTFSALDAFPLPAVKAPVTRTRVQPQPSMPVAVSATGPSRWQRLTHFMGDAFAAWASAGALR